MEKNLSYLVTQHNIRSVLEKPKVSKHITLIRANCLGYLTKVAIFLQSYRWLLLLGITSELIYFFYLLQAFPVTRYFQTLTDMGTISKYSQTAFFTFIIAFSFLFVMFGLAWWEAFRFQNRTTLWIILGFGCIFASTTIFVYPINAEDLFFYIVRSLVLVQHHANPMITAPSQFPHDPLMKLAGTVIQLPSPYGPLALFIQALPLLVAGRNILASLLILKFMFSSLLMITAFIIYKTLSKTAPRFALPATLALAWNPFALLEYSANSHNDIVMAFLVVLAVFALVKERHLWAMTLITASALIKFASLVLIPFFFIYSFRQQPTMKTRLSYIAKALILFLSVIIDCYALFWAGPQTLQRAISEIQGYLYSFSILLVDFFPTHLSYDQGKLIGRILFGICFLYSLWLSSRDFSSFLKGCFLTMFTLLAFGSTFVQPWYCIWPFLFAILIPRISVSLACFLFLYSASLAELVHAFIFAWAGSQYLTIFVISNSVTYLTIFLPPMLFLLASRFKPLLPMLEGEESSPVTSSQSSS